MSPVDLVFRARRPFPVRLFAGLRKPNAVPGDVFAGEIDAAGRETTRFRVGDPVFGTTAPKTGVRAIRLPPGRWSAAHQPATVADSDAAAVCDGVLTARAFLHDVVSIEPGDSVLTNGASGSIGTFAVQLAKASSATVTGVCSSANVDLVTSLGADHVIDYLEESRG